ncbi:MAG TPA: glutathione S-transferase [Phenylobacterium sp.]|nr:glutathione S-transferase [Phenylobacterium sp.]
MLRVLGRTSSLNVRKVLWTLDELGLAYEREDWGQGFASVDRPEFRALNPNGLVPVLIDEAGPLWESNAICRYLAAREGRLSPADLRARALVDQWMDWQTTELNQTWGYAFQALSRRVPGYDDPARIAESAEAWNGAMAILDAQLAKTGAYVTGGDFTLADIVLGLSAHRWKRTPIQHAALPAVEAWYGALRERPAMQPWALAEVA